MKKRKFKLLLFIASICTAGSIFAAINLVTVPSRQSITLTIYNSSDITMVKDVRDLSFKKGNNKIQFSWSGTLIDSSSLRLRFLENKSRFEILDISLPARQKDVLQWNVRSKANGKAKVEITYFTSGITWTADYAVFLDEQKSTSNINGFVKVINNSGEDYPNAKVRLVVGNINLVESIRSLSQDYSKLLGDQNIRYHSSPNKVKKRLRRSFEKKMGQYGKESEEMDDKDGSPITDTKVIIKEAMSEYFIFTINGKESIPNGWKKRMISIKAKDIPSQLIYKLSDRKSSTHAYRYLEFRNKEQGSGDKTVQLGQAPLPNGNYKIFSISKNNELKFLQSKSNKYIAVNDKVSVNLGITSDILIKREIIDFTQTDIKFNRKLFSKRYVDSYKQNWFYQTKLTNTLNKNIKIEIERYFSSPGKTKKIPFKVEKVDKNYIKFYPELKAKSSNKFKYSYTYFGHVKK